MGFLRLLLALSIAFQHSGKSWGVGGVRAVEIFFMISGFYMGLILTSGKYHSYAVYITNRFLRIFPIYWVIALLTLLFSGLAILFGVSVSATPLGPLVAYADSLELSTWLFLGLSNLLIFAQEMTVFMGLENGALYFVQDFNTISPRIYSFELIPQAWSLDVELLFYVIAPFFVWRNKKNAAGYLLLTFILLSLMCKVVLLHQNFNYDPWAYRFFPSILHHFLLGILSYKVYIYAISHLNKKQFVFIAVVLMSCFVSLGAVYYGWYSSHKAEIKNALFLYLPQFVQRLKLGKQLLSSILNPLCHALIICVLFELTKKNRWDRMVGELSYPLYVCHYMIIQFLGLFWPIDQYFSYIVVASSLLMSVGLVRWIQRPIDQYRAKRLALSNVKTVPIHHSEIVCPSSS